jgi:hypothetical protein
MIEQVPNGGNPPPAAIGMSAKAQGRARKFLISVHVHGWIVLISVENPAWDAFTILTKVKRLDISVALWESSVAVI